jgi:hypothetical protein
MKVVFFDWAGPMGLRLGFMGYTMTLSIHLA